MEAASKAPSATWRHPVWSTAQKALVGTAPGPARLWFTVGKGIVTEVFYPRIDVPQVRDMGLIIADGKGFWQELKALPEPQLQIDDPVVPLPAITHWRFRQMPTGNELRFLLSAPFTVHRGVDGWQDPTDTLSEDWDLGHVAILPTQTMAAGTTLHFPFYWRDTGQWQGEDFSITLQGESP